jgi:hypothetical protein
LAREEGIPGFEDSSDGEYDDEENDEENQNGHTHRSGAKKRKAQVKEPDFNNSGSNNSSTALPATFQDFAMHQQNSNQMQVLPEPLNHSQAVAMVPGAGVGTTNDEPVIDFKWNLGLKVFNAWLVNKIEKSNQCGNGGGLFRANSALPDDLLKLRTDELSGLLADFISSVRKANGEAYAPESIYYLCLGVQFYMQEVKRRPENSN